MRGMSQVVARGVLAGSIVVLLAVPAQARPKEDRDRPWFERRIDPIVKVIKKIALKTLGDMLVDPRP